MNLTSRHRAVAWGVIAAINGLNLSRQPSNIGPWCDTIIMLVAVIAGGLFIWHLIGALKEDK